MREFLIIFSLASAGALLRRSAEPVLKFVMRKPHGETMAADLCTGEGGTPTSRTDPILAFGVALACYGAIALALVTALPGSLARERTLFAFALLCVGGLIGEIASTGPAARKSALLRHSMVLTLTLNTAFAVICAGQGLIEIVPPTGRHAQELEPIIVVAEHTRDPLEQRAGPF